MRVDYVADKPLRGEVYIIKAHVDSIPRVGDSIKHQHQHTEHADESEDVNTYEWISLYGTVSHVVHHTATAWDVDWDPAHRHYIEVHVSVGEWIFKDVGADCEMAWDPKESSEPYSQKIRGEILERKRASRCLAATPPHT